MRQEEIDSRVRRPGKNQVGREQGHAGAGDAREIGELDQRGAQGEAGEH